MSVQVFWVKSVAVREVAVAIEPCRALISTEMLAGSVSIYIGKREARASGNFFFQFRCLVSIETKVGVDGPDPAALT